MKYRQIALLLGSASLLAGASAPAFAAKPKTQRAELVTTQLPRNVVPTHYSIRATPDATNLAFSGSTDIEITVKSATDSITLNAADLVFSSASIVLDMARTPAAKIDVDAKAQTATFRFAKKLKPGKYTLSQLIPARSTSKPTACSRLITKTQKVPKNAPCSPSSKPPTHGGSCRAGRAELQGDIRSDRHRARKRDAGGQGACARSS